MSLYGELQTTEARGNYQYIGTGDYIATVIEIKHRSSELKFIVELEIAEVLRAGDHQVGDTVSWLCNYGGDKIRSEMGRKDIRAFNDALIASAGGDASTWTRQQWEEFGLRSQTDKVAGIKLRVRGERYTKKSGEEGKIPRMTWLGVKGQPRRAALIDGWGTAPAAATTATTRPPLPPKPGAAARHPQHEALVDAARAYKEAGESTALGSELHAWATSEGMSDAQYQAAVSEAG